MVGAERWGVTMALIRPFEVCSKDEVEYLMGLVLEHVGHVRLSCKEDGKKRLRVLVEADSPELSRYLGFMLDRERLRRTKSRPAPLRRQALEMPKSP